MTHSILHSARKRRVLPPSRGMSYPSNEYRAIFQSVLVGSFTLIAIITTLLFISYFALGNTYVAPRIILCALGLLYLAATYAVWQHRRPRVASHMLIGFYLFIATIVQLAGGVTLSFGLLVFAICIVLAGILLGGVAPLFTAGLSSIIILLIQTVTGLFNIRIFDTQQLPSGFGDVIAYSTLFAILGLISWLFGRRNENLFMKQKMAEEALVEEKKLLETRVKERTAQLRKAQLDEIEQLYQFAEIGQLSTALLHDLANHLSVLNFDLADLKKTQQSDTVVRAEESITHLEQAVNQVRRQLKGKDAASLFDVEEHITSSTQLIMPKAAAVNVTLGIEAPDMPVMLHGDPLRLSHIVSILVQNAIDAYVDQLPEKDERVVLVIIEQTKTNVTIRVRDHGAGIPKEYRKQLFAPLRSTKKEGLGIGLFIAKKITETHFKGKLVLADTKKYTEFVVTLPKVPR